MGVYLGQGVYNDSQVTKQFVIDEIAKNGKGVFFATHGQTTFANVLAEYNKGKVIICKYQPITPGEVTAWYLALVCFNTETFDFVGVMEDGTIYRTSLNANEGWENVTTFKHDEIQFIEYNVDSYTTVKSYYDAGKFLVLKYQQQTPLVTKYFFYPLISVDETNKEIVFGSLQLGQNNKKITFTVTDSTGWAAPAESPAVVVDAALDSSSHNPVENMAIAAELTAINNKITGDLNDIFLVLASKGVTVPAGAGLDDVAGLITDIPAGGGVEPIPTGYERVTGIKGQWNSSGNPFCFDNLLDTTNQNLISITNLYIDPIPLAPYASGDHRETQFVCPFAEVYFVFYELYGQTRLVIYGTNGGNNYTTDFYPTGLNSFGGYKQIFFQNSTLIMDGVTYNLDSRCYAQTTVKNLNGLFGKWSSPNTNTDITIYECTVKQNDKILAHFIPVKNTSTGVPHFFDEISGRLSTTNLSDAYMISAFTIIP